jgi:hypothetical protein
MFTTSYLNGRKNIFIDSESTVFLSLYNLTADDPEVSNGRACVFHQNGRKVENRVLEELAKVIFLVNVFMFIILNNCRDGT